MINKLVPSIAEALAGIGSGSTILVSGFGDPGSPVALIQGLIDAGVKELTLVSNNGGVGRTSGIAALLAAGRVRKIVCSYPRSKGSVVLQELYAAGRIELELVPQGTLSERMRAGAAGLGGFYTPTAAGTELSNGKETRRIDGRLHVFETPIKGDVALIRAHAADRWGNLIYRGAGRNYGPIMAAAAALTVVQVSHSLREDALAPEQIVTPGIFVDRVVEV